MPHTTAAGSTAAHSNNRRKPLHRSCLASLRYEVYSSHSPGVALPPHPLPAVLAALQEAWAHAWPVNAAAAGSSAQQPGMSCCSADPAAVHCEENCLP
jgi:hypothetical protein